MTGQPPVSTVVSDRSSKSPGLHRGKAVLTPAFVAAVLWLGIEGSARLSGMSPKNRFVLYEARNLLRPGMSEKELKSLLPLIDGKRLEYRWGGNWLSVWTHVGFMRPYFLLIELRDGHVVHASITDGEGGGRVADAPADF